METMLPPSAKDATALEAARHICQEARVLLTSLRGGPPVVARGELAQDLMDLRVVVKAHLQEKEEQEQQGQQHAGTGTDSVVAGAGAGVRVSTVTTPTGNDPTAVKAAGTIDETLASPQDSGEESSRGDTPGMIDEDGPDGAVIVQRPKEPDAPVKDDAVLPESPVRKEPQQQASEMEGPDASAAALPRYVSDDDVGPYARPFLAVVMDPRAAGPHTLAALRSLSRLLQAKSLFRTFGVRLEPLMKGVLACKFEQTDAGADEAVEMAIADLLALLVKLDLRSFSPPTLMEAFNTVFVTRNTFVHSPALCYHFEDVLMSMVISTFCDLQSEAARLILEFLVNQLLHTPLSGGEPLDEPGREAQLAHDATRVLCLRLTRCCLRVGWNAANTSTASEPVLRIIEDDLCLSLLMTGQAVWAYSPGFISIEVLSEICETIATLWNTLALRDRLVSQFETIFTGFYQRALVLLQKRTVPVDSVSFNENLVFDAEIEVILESLVDLLSLQQSKEKASMIETLFATYDCHINRSDVAEYLLQELCKCCGAIINDDGHVTLDPSRLPTVDHADGDVSPEESIRPVPPHLKEFCAEALLSGMKCLFAEQTSGRAQKSSALSTSFTGGTSTVSVRPPELDNLSTDDNMTSSVSQGQLEKSNGLSHRSIKSKKRLMRKAAKLFNQKASKGIDYMVKSGLIVEPIQPIHVAAFLRNGLVLGLEKQAAGQYLGELGKSPVAGKSPPCWERDWFHKEVLSTYCDLFRFEGQSLIDGLRMFLAAFRLPGEGQQIDRIIQAFAESCGRKCDEAVRLRLFSDDPKRAADAAFLLAYSIIMLNTDLHNPQIREDKKMSLPAFLRNNTDYGRDITEKGKEFPPDFLTGVYESIKEEEIRTEKEGAEGHMTVERWKDVLRGSTADTDFGAAADASQDSDDLKELVVETTWAPLVSANGMLWGVFHRKDRHFDIASHSGVDRSQTGMLSAQGARLGMDLALELLAGVRNLGRIDVFRRVFGWVCHYTGLLGPYTTDAVDRTSLFVNSVEAQSAVIVAIQTAHDAGDAIGEEGWRQVWGIVLELRDLHLLAGGNSSSMRSILFESDRDLLQPNSRRDWIMRLMKGDGFLDANNGRNFGSDQQQSGFFGGLGRALFGSDTVSPDGAGPDAVPVGSGGNDDRGLSAHGKEELSVWDDLAPSDDEDEKGPDDPDDGMVGKEHPLPQNRFVSAGADFESQLVHEDMLIHNQTDMPITGLESYEETQPAYVSPRARVRKRLARACDFHGLLSESRFMDHAAIKALVSALVQLIAGTPPLVPDHTEDAGHIHPLSPASEAMAEILLCEIALKNKDRLKGLWESHLRDHYHSRLTATIKQAQGGASTSGPAPPAVAASGAVVSSPPGTVAPATSVKGTVIDPGIEKCVTGLMRISACAILREELADDVVTSLSVLCDSHQRTEIEVLERHIGEGLWRICCNVDGLRQLGPDGWDALIRLCELCAGRGGKASSRRESMVSRSAGLPEDDPALQAYRSIHLLLHTPELQNTVPFSITTAIRRMISTGEKGGCPKLCLAGLDMLHELHSRLGGLITAGSDEADANAGVKKEQATGHWTRVLEGIADVGEHSADPVSAAIWCCHCSCQDRCHCRRGSVVSRYPTFVIALLVLCRSHCFVLFLCFALLRSSLRSVRFCETGYSTARPVDPCRHLPG